MEDGDLLRVYLAEHQSPATAFLGAELVSFDQSLGEARMTFQSTEHMLNPIGSTQGGFVTAMLDEVMTTAGMVATAMKSYLPTLDIRTDFLDVIGPGPIDAVGRVRRRGKYVMFLEGQLLAPANGHVLAAAAATARVISKEDFAQRRNG